MADVFISYAREDHEAASRLMTRLKAEGWTVFWDTHVKSGDEWRKVIETAVRSANCVVVLWSNTSISSRWVREEAEIGLERRVLVQALIGPAKPPFGFAEFQASNLANWDGVTDSQGLANLIRAITVICGSRQSVTLWPLKLFIVIGWPSRLPGLGATININCRFVNELMRPVSVRWLEASADGPNALSYHFTWKVPYDTVGHTEHVRRIEPTPAIEVPPGGIERGIQLQAPAFSDRVTWPRGEYSCEILGWTDHKRTEPANLRTQFGISVSDNVAGQVEWLMAADDSTWQRLKPSDDAIGVEVDIVKVRVGLPAD